MHRLLLFFFTASLSFFSYAEFGQYTHRWVAVFDTGLVNSCDAQRLIDKLNGLSSETTLSLLRPFGSCGIIFLSDALLDPETLIKQDSSIRYIEPDGINKILPVMPTTH
ncbi:hypothetical protein [Endozoicomonas sp. ONNA1]|uniref:hypothetical protein n=1 Tax=Endozoicomonas sp. ONNA1 TaxID=2828740 RepID=UPI00214958F5|nr:hypothetical protein [Endozoicomonas sp. ONNA1]